MTYEEIATKHGMSEVMTMRYVSYMKMRWADTEDLKCQTGYASEWAFRFLNGDEYAASDMTGQMILAEIDHQSISSD